MFLFSFSSSVTHTSNVPLFCFCFVASLYVCTNSSPWNVFRFSPYYSKHVVYLHIDISACHRRIQYGNFPIWKCWVWKYMCTAHNLIICVKTNRKNHSQAASLTRDARHIACYVRCASPANYNKITHSREREKKYTRSTRDSVNVT